VQQRGEISLPRQISVHIPGVQMLLIGSEKTPEMYSVATNGQTTTRLYFMMCCIV